MTSSNGNIFRVTGHLCGQFTGPGEFPSQRPVTRSFDVFFDLRMNKWLSKQSWGWWFETPSWSLWRHCNVEDWANRNKWVLCFCKARYDFKRDLTRHELNYTSMYMFTFIICMFTLITFLLYWYAAGANDICACEAQQLAYILPKARSRVMVTCYQKSLTLDQFMAGTKWSTFLQTTFKRTFLNKSFMFFNSTQKYLFV